MGQHGSATNEIRVASGDGQGHPTQAYDFGSLDFARLWRGREKVTEVERAVVRTALLGVPRGRVLEVGPGAGRITATLRDLFDEYVGIDVTRSFLQATRRSEVDHADLLVGDVAHLPFRSEGFAAAVMIRVYNFLTDPDGSLLELYRILRPGGRVVFSYHSIPSLATLHDDLVKLLQGTRSRGLHASTFGRRETELPRRRRTQQGIRRAGFDPVAEYVTGAEEYRLSGWLPARAYIALAGPLAGIDLLPHRFVVAQKPR